MGPLLIIGADHLGDIPNKLTEVGFEEVLHIKGRNTNKLKKELPRKVSCILVLTDFVNHNLSTYIKKQAKRQAIPIYYAKRSWCSINHVLTRIL